MRRMINKSNKILRKNKFKKKKDKQNNSYYYLCVIIKNY